MACSSVPKNTQNSCATSREIPVVNMQNLLQEVGVPIHMQLAFVKKESDFNWLVNHQEKDLSYTF